MLEFCYFLFFSIMILITGFFVIRSNPIHSVFFLVLSFCNATGLLLLLGVEFVGMLILVIYVGAVAILFLFVVMMLDLNIAESEENYIRYLPLSSILWIIFSIQLYSILKWELGEVPYFSLILDSNLFDINMINYTSWADIMNDKSNIETVGFVLYSYFYDSFFIGSFILLVAMIGAIVLTMHQRTLVKRQFSKEQVTANFNSLVNLVV